MLLVEFFAYLKKRLIYFHKYEGDILGTEQGSNVFNDCILSCFEERIFTQNKSKLLQYIPLFVMGHANKNLSAPTPKPVLNAEATIACNTFSQLILSFLVRTSFPEETQETEVDSSSTMLDRRMRALNYLGSLLTQNVVKLPA